jgi:hypothetical protein
MNKSESAIQREVRLLSRGDVRLFRNNTGSAWAGPSTRVTPGNLATARASLRPGDVVVRAGRVLHAGLATGSGDLIGWRSQLIGPEHVGQTIAQFASVEIKAARGRVSPEQRQWAETVQQHGGIGAIVRSVEEAEEVLGLSPDGANSSKVI